MKTADTSDVQAINAVLNHPEVRPLLEYKGLGELDFSGSIATHPTYCGDGWVIFGEPMGFGVYLGVSAFVPDAQGIAAVVAHRWAFDRLFTTTDAVRVLATIDPGNARAVRNVVGLGFMPAMPKGKRVIMGLDWVNWALNSRACRHAGWSFCTSWGIESTDEEAHLLGAFLMTVRASGDWTKALSQFNLWASANQSRRLKALDPDRGIYQLGSWPFTVKEVSA